MWWVGFGLWGPMRRMTWTPALNLFFSQSLDDYRSKKDVTNSFPGSSSFASTKSRASANLTLSLVQMKLRKTFTLAQKKVQPTPIPSFPLSSSPTCLSAAEISQPIIMPLAPLTCPRFGTIDFPLQILSPRIFFPISPLLLLSFRELSFEGRKC